MVRRLMLYGVDVESSLYPSFLYPLFERRGTGYFVKVWGYGAGFMLRQVRYLVAEAKIPSNVDEEWVRAITGAWLDPGSYLPKLRNDAQEVVRSLLKAHPGLRIVASPMDWVYVFISAFLSRNTDFHVNTVKWVRAIARLFNDPREIVEDPGRLELIGRSYQLVQLPEALGRFLRKVSLRDCDEPDALRRKLLTIPYVGPKVTDSYLLFACMISSAVPVDKNLLVFLRRVVNVKGGVAPSKNMCLRSAGCVEAIACPYISICVAATMRRLFGRIAGWVQTASYLHVKRWCRRRLCGHCALKAVCRDRG